MAYPTTLEGASGSPGPINALLGSFWLYFSLSLSLLTSKKISRVILSLTGPSFQLQSIVSVFSSLEVSVYFSYSLIFMQNVSSNTTRDAC